MSIVRRVARPLLAAVFIKEGVVALRDKDAAAELAEGFGARIARPLGLEETRTDVVVRANAGVQIGAGVLLATGRFPRLAAVALAGSLVATTIARDSFWSASVAGPASQAGPFRHGPRTARRRTPGRRRHRRPPVRRLAGPPGRQAGEEGRRSCPGRGG
ncbi:DoxX family protein [Fodinicola feengrottensis]|uniref:DoxX family protein n=1 Tax=Fodinicola feengrottensis TaxID=435914 RepID=UPI002441B90D|nr:DoxX family protein [Fodinicola feengrottensis]